MQQYGPNVIAAFEFDDVKSIVIDLRSTATRLNSPYWMAGNLFSQRESGKDAWSLINRTEKTLTDIQSLVRSLQKKVDLPDFGSVAVLSCWELGIVSTPDQEIGLRHEHSPIDSKLTPRISRRVDERQLGWSYQMEPVEVNDVDENPAYRGKEVENPIIQSLNE